MEEEKEELRIKEEQIKMKLEVEEEKKRESDKAKENNKQNIIAAQLKRTNNDPGPTQELVRMSHSMSHRWVIE